MEINLSGIEYKPDSGKFYREGKEAGTLTKSGYRQIRINGKIYYEHRVAWYAMTGEWPTEDIDHRDRNKSNNSWNNLRIATRSQNMSNIESHKDSFSKYKGVSFFKRDKLWRSQISINGKNTHIGYYPTEEEASEAYIKKSKEIFGEYVCDTP